MRLCGSELVEDVGLYENVHLNTWSSVSDAIWGGLGHVALL